MKVRNGFVSNSSSSSFILKSDGVTLDKKGTLEWIKNPENSNKQLLVIGEEMAEGDDIFYLDGIKENVILEHEERFLNNKSSWTAYPNVESWECEDYKSFYSEEEEEEYDKKLLNPPYVIRTYKDYNSDSEEDIQEFIIRYFYTWDERDFVYECNYDYDYYPSRGSAVLAYTDKMEVPKDGKIPEDWEDIFIGINEFGGVEGGFFSYKKLTEGDLKRIKSGKETFKEGATLYNNLIVQKRKKESIIHFKDKDYHIVIVNSVLDKVKALKPFLKRNEYV